MSLIALLQVAPPADTSLATGLLQAVNSFTDYLLSYVIALAAVGALAMAIIEAWKKVFDTRTKFHARRFTSWVRKSMVESPLARLPEKPTAVDAIADILQLSTGVSRREAVASAKQLSGADGRLATMHAFSPDPAHAVFALELDRMMGAVQDAGDAALAAPEQFPALYAFMTTGGVPDDVNLWYDKAKTGFADANAPDAVNPRKVKELADATARLRQVMKRKLDGFQMFTGSRWASWNQTWAMVLGYGLMFLLLFWSSKEQNDLLEILEISVLSIFGGLLSPIAKDLVGSLKRVSGG